MTITYELAKELKEAGFPKEDWVEEGYYEDFKANNLTLKEPMPLPNKPKFGYQMPTLSELIEACGEEFSVLTKRGGEYEAKSRGKMLSQKITDFKVVIKGVSPEEAVAKLWLELNK